tara:strand:+ start:129 stop:722 length:594 start_codon:yes stop_codon:yes gene_type:complete
LKQFILVLTATFCLASAGQEVCRPELVPFGVHRLELENGYLHSTGGFANDTRVIEVDYIDNRRIITNLLDSQGTVTLTNTTNDSNLARRVKYRHRVSVPLGDYTITQHETDYEVCAHDGEVIFYTDAMIANGASYTRDWIYTVEIQVWGDLNDDGYIDGYDLGMLFIQWGMDGVADFNSDGIVDAQDLGILLANWTG